MGIDTSARRLMHMIERLYAGGRDVVTKEDVQRAAMRADLGNEGYRAVRGLPPGYYSKQELKDALTEAIFGER